jgi:predicted dehydrogenase
MWYFDKVKRIDVLHKEVLLKKRNIENKLRRVDADDVILLKIENNKMKIVCQCDLVSPSYMNYVEIHGTNGSVCTSILDFFPTVLYCKEPKGIYDRGHNFFNFPKVDLFYEELKFFLDSVRKNGDENKTDSIDQSIEMLKLLEKASLLYEF